MDATKLAIGAGDNSDCWGWMQLDADYGRKGGATQQVQQPGAIHLVTMIGHAEEARAMVQEVGPGSANRTRWRLTGNGKPR